MIGHQCVSTEFNHYQSRSSINQRMVVACMIVNINFHDSDYHRNLLRDAIFQFSALHSISFNQNARPTSSKTQHDTFSYLSKVIKGFHQYSLVQRAKYLRIGSEIGSAIIYCKRDCCLKLKSFLHIHYFVFISTTILLDYKVSIRLIRHPQLNCPAIKLYEYIDLSYVPCKL